MLDTLYNNPFKQVESYSEEDALFFYGRERWQQLIIDNLKQYSLTVLHGESGVGKTSVLQAGVCHKLQKEIAENWEKHDEPMLAVVVFDDWSKNNPVEELKQKILNSVAKAIREEPDTLDKYTETLKDKRNKAQEMNVSLQSEFVQTLEIWTELISKKTWDGKLLIILDQFEEYFTNQPKTDKEENFVTEFSNALNYFKRNVKFLISIRSDSRFKLDRFMGDIPGILNNCIELEHLDEKSTQEAISKPVDEFNRQQIILDNLQNSRLTFFFGDSGVGKSLVLQKGIAHRLREKAKAELANGTKPEFIVIFFDSWKNNPIEGFKQKIQDDIKFLLFDSWKDNPIEEQQKIQENIKSLFGKQIFKAIDSSLTLTQTLETWKERLWGKGERGTLLIILDQFEEYLQDSPHEKVEEKFAVEFTEAVNCSNLDAKFLISCRGKLQDKISSKCKYFKDKGISNLPDSYLELLENHSISTKPFTFRQKRGNISINKLTHRNYTIEKSLINKVLKDVQKGKIDKNDSSNIGYDSSTIEGSKIKIEAPYLQIVMHSLWQEARNNQSYDLNLETYKNQLHGAEQIVEKHLDDRINELSSEKEREIASHIFHFLVTPSGAKNCLAENDLFKDINEERESHSLSKIERDDINKVLNILIHQKSRILRPVTPLPGREKQRYQIYHDALAPAILKWRTYYLKGLHSRTIKRGLPAQSLRQLRYGKHDLAALLALEAHKFNEQDNLDMLDEVDDALRQALSVDYFSQIFRGHTDSVSTVAYSRDSTILASASHDYSIVRYNLSSNNSESNGDRINNAHLDKILAIAFAPNPEPNSKILVSGSQDGTVKLWNLDEESLQNTSRRKILCKHSFTNKEKQVLPYHITSLVFSQDGSMLAIGSVHGTIILFKLKNSKSLLTLDDIDDEQLDDEQLKVDKTQFGTISLNPSWKHILKAPIYILQNQGEKEGRKVCSLAFRPKVQEGKEGNWLAAGYNDGTVRLWDLNQTATKLACNIQEIKSYKSVRPKEKDKNNKAITVALKKAVKGLAFNQDGNILAFGGEDCAIWLCHVDKLLNEPKSQGFYERLDKHEDLSEINSLAFHPTKDNILASAGEDQKVRLWNVRQLNKKIEKLPGQYFGISSVAFSPNGKWLATGSWNHRVHLWDLELPPEVKPLILNNTQINESEKIELEESSILKENLYATHQGNVMFVAVSENGNMIASASWDRTVGFWKRESSDKKFDFHEFPKLHNERVWSVAFSKDKKLLASSGVNNYKSIELRGGGGIKEKDNKVVLWNLGDIDQKREIRSIKFPEQKEGISSLAFSPNSKILATALWVDQDHSQEPNYSTVLLWDISKITDNDWGKGEPAEKRTINLQHHEDKNDNYKKTVTTVVFHPTNDQIMATAGDDGIVKLWYFDDPNWPNWNEPKAQYKSILLKKHQEKEKDKDKDKEKITVRSLAFSPDGKILASGSQDKDIRLWDLSHLNWEGIDKPNSIVIKDNHSENSHSSWVGSVAFSKDSDGNLILASAGYEGTIKLWNLEDISECDWQNGAISRKSISLRDHEQSVTSVAFIPNNPNNSNSPYKLVSGSYDNTVRLWITSTKELANMVKEKVWRSLTDDERERFEIPKRDEQ